MNNKQIKKLTSISLVISIIFILLGVYCNLYKEQINLSVSGKEVKVSTFKKTVEELLDEQHINFDENDKISHSLDTKLRDNMNINIIKVDIKSIKEYATIPYETNIIEDKNINKGVTHIYQKGSNGKKELTYNLIFEDNKLVEKKLIQESIYIKPVDKIIKKGTKEIFILASRGEYTRISKYNHMNVIATAYSSGNITSTGTRPKWGTIAVDPKVIPYGSKVYIPVFNSVFTAEDCGGAIKGNKIDIFMNDEDKCHSWGRRSIEIYVID